MSSGPSLSKPKESLCGCALRTGTSAFFKHCFWLIAILLFVAGAAYLSAGRLGSSFKNLIQQKVNEELDGSGIRVVFDDIQFVEGEGIRIDGLQVYLSDATLPPNRIDAADANQFSFDSENQLGQVRTVRAGRFVPVIDKELGNATWDNSARQETVVQAEVQAAKSSESFLAAHTLFRPFYPILGDANKPTPDIEVKHLWVRGQWNPATFLSGKFQPDAVEIVSPQVHMTLDKDGNIRWPKLVLPKPKTGLPKQILITDGQAHIACERTSGKRWPVSINSLRLDLVSREMTQPPASALDAHWKVNAKLSVMGLPEIQVGGQWQAGAFGLTAQGQPTHVHSQLWQQLRPWFPEKFRFVEGINGWVHLEQLVVAGSIQRGETSRPLKLDQFEAKASVRQMQLQDARLPQPILNLTADLTADANGIRCENAQGQIGDGRFQLTAALTNWSEPVTTARLIGEKLRFTRRWVPLLTEKQQKDWMKFQPEGLLSCDLNFTRLADGKVTKQGTIDVEDMSYVFADFPVPISGAAGRFELDNRDCKFVLNVNNQIYPLAIDGFANNMGPDWTGKVNIRSTQFHPIHESALEGLKKKPQVIKVIREMNPSGLMAINGFIEKTVAGQKADVVFNVGFRDGVVQHMRFPYRVSGIGGEMRYENGSVLVDKLEGVSSTGNISASGRFAPGQPWHVKLVGHAVELNTELYQALAENQQEVWRHLRPRGVLDEVVVDLYDDRGKCKVRISGSQKPSTLSDPSYLSVNPDWFPYQLDGLSGKFHYENNQVRLTGIRGSHGSVSVTFDGKGQTSQDDWQVTIYNLLTGQIPIGRDIKAALPETVKTAAEQLKLAGSVSVQGAVTISRESLNTDLTLVDNSGGLRNTNAAVHRLNPTASTRTYRMQDSGRFEVQPAATHHQTVSTAAHSGAKLSWDLRLDMENSSLMVGLPAKHVHGMVRLNGESSHQSAYCGGTLNIDSAMIEGIQVTDIQGPIWMNEREIVFGTQVAAATNSTSQQNSIASVTMQSMGGRIDLDGRVLLVDDMPFSVRATVNHLDLKKMAATFAPETNDIAGMGFASLTVHGTSVGTHTLSGGGTVGIAQARLYEVPLFLQLLKILRVRTPDKTAFDEGEIEFRIAGEDIQLNRIELNGDAISLLGRGQANFNHEIDLEFYTVLGRNRFHLPFLSYLLHASSQQLLTINVDGTVDNPNFQHETGRALNEAVRLFVEDVEATKKLGQSPR